MPPIRNLLLLSLMQKRFLNTTSATPTSSSSSSSFTVEYLINSCGLSFQSALSASRKLQLHENKLQKPQSVLEFLKSHDFNHTHIAKLIGKEPKVLQCRVEDNLKPKFEFLITNGFAGQHLPQLIVSNPIILGTSLDACLKPSFELLKSLLYSNAKIVSVVRRDSWLLTGNSKDNLQTNMDFLIKEGVPVDRVTKLLVLQPRSIIQKRDRMVHVVNALKDLGLEPEAPIFIHAVRAMTQMTKSTWKKKMEVMKSVGWSEEEILCAFKQSPLVLTTSEEKIRRSTDFLLNTVKLELQAIIRRPSLLMYAIDKRLRPRYNVFRVLQSKKLIKEDKKIEWLLMMGEKDFLENYVTKYVHEVPDLLEIYRGASKAEKIGT